MNRPPDRKGRGFSIAEILVALAVMALLLGVGALRQGSERSRADSEAIALAMLAELNAARAQAQATRRPVAVCWPSKGIPTCQSFYNMEGLSKGRVTRSRDFSGDFSKGFLAVGYWGDATVDRPVDGAREVDPVSWLPPNFKDYAIIFDPQGKVATNDLPLQDGSYRITACASVGATAATPSGKGRMREAPSYFEFSRIAAPHTIFVKPNGAISMTEGAPGLTVDAHPFPMDSPASPMEVAKAVFSEPVIDLVELQASPVLATVGTVTRTGSLNVKVMGSDDTGDDLYLQWSSKLMSGSATDSGYFSQSGRYRMDWNPAAGKWESIVSWAPPDDAAVGDKFQLTFVMSNSVGSKDSGGFVQLDEVEVVDDDILLATGSLGVYKVHKNGTGFEMIMPSDKGPGYINVSPDGSRMIWDQSAYDRHAVWVGNLDGSGATLVTNAYRNVSYPQPVWNDIGTTVFLAGSSSGQGGVLCVKADGTGLTEVLPRVVGHSYTSALDVSKDGRYLAAIQHIYRTPGDYSVQHRDLWLGKLNQSAYPPRVDYWTNLSRATGGQVVGNSNTYLTFQEVFPGPDRPVLVVRAAGSGNAAWVVEATDTGTDFSAIFSPLQNERGQWIGDRDITFSPDGTEAVGVDASVGGLNLYDWDTAGGVPRLVNRRQMLPSKPWLTSVDWR